MSKPLRIDFVSDVSCPWCVVGLNSLQQALANVGDAASAELYFQPFELNPDMVAGGEDTQAHLAAKYGLDADQLARNRDALRERGAEVGFVFNQRSRIYNTFDAHRLLHWAGELGFAPQLALKEALLHAYFTDDLDVSSHEVLTRLVEQVGLDVARAREVLDSDEYTTAVRAQQQLWRERGINSVPAIIIDQQYLIQGGQPVEVFEQALRRILTERAAG